MAAFTATLVPATQAQAADLGPNARYDLVHGCYALKAESGGKLVAKAANGYAVSADGVATAEPFRLQATRLGDYLLYGKAGDFLSTTAGGAVVTSTDPGPAADFTVDRAAGNQAFTLVSQAGKALTVGDGGRLALTTPGSAGRFTFVPAEGCATFPEAELGATGKPSTGKTPYSETKGLIDAHMHMMAYEFLGGSIHCGAPWNPYGITKALPTCAKDNIVNQQGSGVVDNFLAGGNPIQQKDPVGWPTFGDWPNHESLIYEQSYYRWLERAWMSGLRVFVNLFVENHALCSIYPVKKNNCNEMESVRLQAKRLRQLQDYIDAQEGGPGKGWFRIVKDPFEARRTINAGKLAVVPGIEVSNLFDCGLKDGSATCTRAQVDAGLTEAYDKLGVRDMELINKFDNGFGGVAGDAGSTGLIINGGNKLETGAFWDLETCTGPAEESDREQLTLPGLGRDELLGAALGVLAPNSTLPLYPPGPHCNKRGLSDLGRYLVRSMAKRGMIIDPDHLSVNARRSLLAEVESTGYGGIVSSHSWSTKDAYPRIYERGGIVTPYAGGTTGFLQAWKSIKPTRDKRFLFGFGYGADMNGFGSQGGPRNGPNPVKYPFKSFDGAVTFERQKTGQRTFDINTDGVAHYGLYADWLEDLKNIGGRQIIDDMANGAEAYVQMWERAIGIDAEHSQRREGRLRFTAKGLGATRLAVDPEELLRGGGQPATRKARVWSYRVKGKGNAGSRIKAVFSGAEKVVLVSSNAVRHRAVNVGRGTSAAKLKGVARPFGAGVLIRSAGGGRSYLYGVRKGRVTWTAVASSGVTKSAATTRRYLALADLIR
ncbi:hypothetical protein DSM112329_03071 [Paraconexibacter sp. AEG42_29]|uniref:Peptidase n=1 Tax=Paraconexibacter sp. AEG42_29 TaxID=2997339 RepID=A0AAU7AX43_9ACTN